MDRIKLILRNLRVLSFFRKYACIFIFLFLWEFLSRVKIINPVFFPPVSVILLSIWKMTLTGEMLLHVKASLLRAIPGFLLASILGVPLGLVLGTWFKPINRYFDIPLEVFSQLNPFLLFHILILFMGIGEAPKVSIVVWTCLWPIVFSSMNGASSVSLTLIKAGRAFGLSNFGLFLKIILPGAAPLIFAGLELGLSYSMFMLIAAEMMGASSGLGFLTLNSQETFQLVKMYSAVVVIAFLGLALNYLLNLLSRKFMLTKVQGFISVTEN
jgi:NitT/TauT family transport system permease protein